jgi:CRP-like cAMP-binding protein
MKMPAKSEMRIPKLDSLWNHPLLAGFSDELRTWLAPRLEKKSLKKGDVLFSQGDLVKGIYLHLEGLTKITQADEKGALEFSRLVVPGDTSGHRSLFLEETYKGTAEVLSPTSEVVFIRIEDITSLLSKSLSFTKSIIVKISTELRRSEEQHVQKTKKSVRGRVADLILNLCDNYYEDLGEK